MEMLQLEKGYNLENIIIFDLHFYLDSECGFPQGAWMGVFTLTLLQSEPGTMGQSCYQSTRIILGRAGKKPGCLHNAARALLVLIINESTLLLCIVNKSLNPSLEGGSRIALYKSGVVSSGIVYQLASNPGFSCSLFKNSVSPAAVP